MEICIVKIETFLNIVFNISQHNNIICVIELCSSCGENAICRYNGTQPGCMCPLEGDDSDPATRCSKSNIQTLILLIIMTLLELRGNIEEEIRRF